MGVHLCAQAGCTCGHVLVQPCDLAVFSLMRSWCTIFVYVCRLPLRTYAYRCAHVCADMRTNTLSHMHTYMHAHMHTHTHVHTHTHICVLQACIMLLIATLAGLDNSFLTSVDWEDFTQVSEPYRWYTAVYWVITTVSELCADKEDISIVG